MAATEEYTEDEVQPIKQQTSSSPSATPDPTTNDNESTENVTSSQHIDDIDEEEANDKEMDDKKPMTTEHIEQHTEDELKPINKQTSNSKEEEEYIKIEITENVDDENDDKNDKNDDDEKNKNEEETELDTLNPNDLGDFGMIDRAHSDPLALNLNERNSVQRNSIAMASNKSDDIDDEEEEEKKNPDTTTNESKRNSIFLAPKRYHSVDDIMDNKKLGDFPGFNIREISRERVPIKYDHGRQAKEEEIVVPSRENLVKIPFYSTPLTLEATNNAFFDFKERLNEMGFIEQSEAALVHTQCESVENAVAFILNNFDAIFHRFEYNKNINKSLESINELTEDMNEAKASKLCTICNQPFDQHLIDENGNKILIGLNENNYNHNDDIYVDEESIDLMEIEENDGNDESVKIEIYGKAMNPTSTSALSPLSKIDIDEIIKKTESELEPKPIYDGPTNECLICFDEKPVDYFNTTECGHDYYCKECLTQHYKVKTKDGDVLKVKCIDPKCEREIKEDEILNFLTDEAIKQKFIKFKRQKLLMLDENARFCPAPNCEGYMIGSRLKPKLECPECKTTICFNCSKIWHGYFTKCTSAQTAALQGDGDENDQKYFQWELNKDVKKCPKCKMRIEKNEGCNHMTCVTCKYEFCWICKGKYDSNHFSEWNIFGCPGGQYNNQVLSINRCPDCCPLWLRRCTIALILILLLPLIIVIGIIVGCVYGCAICIVFLFENICGCC